MPDLWGSAGEAEGVRVWVLGGRADDDHGLVRIVHRVQHHELFRVLDRDSQMNTTLPFALARRWLALCDSGLRRGVIASDMRDLDASSLALYFKYLLVHRDRDETRALYLDTALVILEADPLTSETRRDLIGRLSQDTSWPVFTFLCDAPDQRPPAVTAERPYDFEDVPLGVRKARARLGNLDTLFKMAADPDPGVVRILLGNPKATEDHALRVASRQPQTRGVFIEVLRSRFGVRERVQMALVSNPFCPVRLAVALTPLLTRPHLEDVRGAPVLDRRVREAAQVLLAAR